VIERGGSQSDLTGFKRVFEVWIGGRHADRRRPADRRSGGINGPASRRRRHDQRPGQPVTSATIGDVFRARPARSA
jgi:hypothetical protein